ncbi:DUF3920 family protein [Ectobacillus sp. JY-23]|uniref:DUF3920 family protein n=1 Tax=Ectobacillus sp. JY-23 TaxID=2933872 RepID=UPI001FF4BF79|nr:DUF3920 family protein [Ectobacillus sp. JY-23]UOY91028.1 DUF3920 family protein [Ectobacillus sp. JY-23]
MEFPLPKALQQAGNWCVFDEDFPWNLYEVREDVFGLVGQTEVAVLFCDTCEANQILLHMGEEEEEFLFPLYGYYHQRSKTIFIFMWEDYERMLETILHEIRHDMQFQQSLIRHVFHAERHLPYEERWIEKDAREFAREKMRAYKRRKA